MQPDACTARPGMPDREQADPALTRFVQRAYRVRVPISVVKRERNPHLDHACADRQYDVDAHCHSGHVWEELLTVTYNAAGDQCLVARSTCGQFSVWMD